MIDMQNVKILSLVDPDAIVDNAGWTSNEIDTKGFDHALVVVQLGDTDIAMVKLAMEECDTTGGSFVDIAASLYGTATNTAGATSTLPTAGEDNLLFLFDIDLRKRKRFLQLDATAGDGTLGTYLSAIIILSRAEEGPCGDATKQGASQILRF